MRGAGALSHEAVSALLRLPVLCDLDITGCSRISSMDRMRLVRRAASCRSCAASAGAPGPCPLYCVLRDDRVGRGDFDGKRRHDAGESLLR